MASWADVEREAPELAGVAREYLEARKHRTIATLRRDGSPRISGTELYVHDGELWIGSMSGARKALDLRRDPRFALHSGSVDPPDWTGDAKVAGRAEEIVDLERAAAVSAAIGGGEAGSFHLFRLDLEEVSVVRLDEARKNLVVELWRPGEGVSAVRPGS